jgi:hypothetical protein
LFPDPYPRTRKGTDFSAQKRSRDRLGTGLGQKREREEQRSMNACGKLFAKEREIICKIVIEKEE